MAKLKRIARTRAVPRVGYALRGRIHDVPDDLVDELLATGEWEEVGKPPANAPERVVEPAPSKPAAKPQARRKAKK